MSGNLHNASVERVRSALKAAGHADTIRELSDAARTAEQAAQGLGVELGQIVKSLVFTVGNRYVVALVAGDKRCKEDQLGRVFNLKGDIVRPQADLVRAASGFAIGGVAPVGMPSLLPTVIDASLKRFDKVYPAAGHPHCVFETTVTDLKHLTHALVSYAITD